jgi:UDPglucose--hexose-1-phosphate uridylyltransferase
MKSSLRRPIISRPSRRCRRSAWRISFGPIAIGFWICEKTSGCDTCSSSKITDHPHSQLIALPIVPTNVTAEIEGCREHYQNKERCIYCDIIRQESGDRTRVVTENGEFLSIVPFAPRFPFEIWILPKRHASCFEQIQKFEVEGLARIFSDTLRRLDRVLAVPPFNFILHTSPLHEQAGDFYHWHIEIIPKLTQIAGFEWGTGFYINPVLPEEAAVFLRNAEI